MHGGDQPDYVVLNQPKTGTRERIEVKNQLRGIALILLSITLMLGALGDGWRYFFDLSISWQHVFALLGVIGTLMVFLPEKKEKK